MISGRLTQTLGVKKKVQSRLATEQDMGALLVTPYLKTAGKHKYGVHATKCTPYCPIMKVTASVTYAKLCSDSSETRDMSGSKVPGRYHGRLERVQTSNLKGVISNYRTIHHH